VFFWFDDAMSHGPQEGAVRLAGSPSLYVEGSSQWVSVAWEEGDTKHPLGSGVPEAISSSITGFVKALQAGSISSDYTEWVLSLTNPVRALQGKPGPGADQVTLLWQAANDGSTGVEQTVTMEELASWPGALDLYGPSDPDEVRRPDVYTR
jgi:hypothetical protein